MLNRHPDQYLVDTSSTYHRQSVDNQPTHMHQLKNRRLTVKVNHDADGVLIKHQLRCQWSANQASAVCFIRHSIAAAFRTDDP